MRILFALLIAATAAFIVLSPPQQHPSRGYGEARIGGAFTLSDTHGMKVSDRDFRGRLMLVYMGYSHCPDVCPLTLATISDALKSLGPDADKVAVIFISLDPERDTPQMLASFLSAFDPRIIGLTGSRAAIDDAAKAYRVYYKKTPMPATGSYLIDHSGFLYLMDKKGEYLAHFDADTKAPALAHALREHF